MSIYLIVYVILVLLVLVWAANAPHTPTSLDPEGTSVWEFPGWYILILLLILVGIVIHKIFP